MDKTFILKENSEAIRSRIAEAGISVCHCASFADADWLDYHTSISNGVHGNGYPYEGMTKEETRAMFLREVKNPVFCDSVKEFIDRIKEHEAWVKGSLPDDAIKEQEDMRQEEGRHCGECCWFYGEDTWGYGSCPFRFAELQRCSDKCPIAEKYVSKKEMRHHMYALLAMKYWFEGNHHHNVSPHEMHEAMDFAYKYMKVFSKL